VPVNVHAEHSHGSVPSRSSGLRAALFLSPPFTCHRLSKERFLWLDVQPDVSNISPTYILFAICLSTSVALLNQHEILIINRNKGWVPRPSCDQNDLVELLCLPKSCIVQHNVAVPPRQDINALFLSCLKTFLLRDGYMRCLENMECLSVTTILVDEVLACWLCPVQREEMDLTQAQVIEVLEVGLNTY
jgi:hypothetical protein